MHVGLADIAEISKPFYYKYADLADIAYVTKTFGCKALVVSAILAKPTCL